MKKDIKNALDEKLQVKLPESLSKENIIADIQNSKTEIMDMPKKKNVAKILVPVAASFMLIVGLIGMYFGMGLGNKDIPVQDGNITEVVRYQSYDKIYNKFDKLHKEFKNSNYQDMFGNVFNEFSSAQNTNTNNMGSREEIAVDDSLLGGDTAMPDSTNGSSVANKQHGTTNTQEKGVDEGDIIKTDGKYLYIVNTGKNAPVSIVDCTGKEMKLASTISFDEKEEIRELYVQGERLVAIGNLYNKTPKAKAYNNAGDYVYGGYYSFDTFVKVYDISDRTKPERVTEYSQQGNYDNSRMIGSKLYTVSTYYVNVRDKDYRDNCIPETEINGVCEKIDAGCISIIEDSNSTTYAVITTLDVENGDEPSCEAVLGNCEELYASVNGMFLSDREYDEKSQEITKIYRFEYTDTGVNYKCMGKADGYINNQFSMSYDGEYFRIATTLNKNEVSGEWADDMVISSSASDRVNNLYILNNNMQIVGKVEDLAKGETIKSVRFVNDMAYVVTFRQTDPLFVIDLSNPEKPTVKGELKIPGFSEYLHPIVDGLLVGVGQDGTETGTNGDCKVSLFDVSNPYEPKETVALSVGNGKAYSYSEVSTNHKLYINLSETEFAVPFLMRAYWNQGNPDSANCYIRYKLQNNTLCEMQRYDLGDDVARVLGATYIDNIFYVVLTRIGQGVEIMSFDLETHQETGRLQTYKWDLKTW